jgi:hypothetical protein
MVNGLLPTPPQGGKFCRVDGFGGMNLPGRRRVHFCN